MLTGSERLLTVHEAAARLSLKPSTIRRMILQRRIDVVRPSIRAVRIPESAIQRMVRQGYRAALQRDEKQYLKSALQNLDSDANGKGD